jgi:hypothetical protein
MNHENRKMKKERLQKNLSASVPSLLSRAMVASPSMLALLTTHEIKRLGESPVQRCCDYGRGSLEGSTTIRVGQFCDIDGPARP